MNYDCNDVFSQEKVVIQILLYSKMGRDRWLLKI